MRVDLLCSVLFLLLAQLGVTQIPPGQSPVQSDSVTLNKAGGGVTAPGLIPMQFTTADCETPISGEVELATIVDISGAPRNIMFVHPLGNDLDALALSTLAAERFKPGESKGSPVPVAESVSMKLQACPVHLQADSKTGTTYLRVHVPPEQHFGPTDVYPPEIAYSNASPGQVNGGVYRVGPDVSPPVMLQGSSMVEIGSGKRAKFEGEVMLTLIVDSNGMPMNIRVTRPLGLGLDQKAMDAMRQARFKPAMYKGRRPVPVMMTLSVQCRIY